MRQKLQLLIDNQYIKGGFFLTLSSFIVNFINYIFYFVAGRTVGPSGYGEITSFYSYISLILAPLTVTSTFLIQKISSMPSNKSIYAFSLEKTFWKIIKEWFWLMIVFILIVPFIPKLTNLSSVVAYLLFPYMVIVFISTFYNATFQGLKLFIYLSIFNVFTGIFKLISLIPGIIFSNNVSYIIGSQTVLLGILLIIMVYFVKEKIYPHSQKTKLASEKNIYHLLSNRYFIMTLFSILGMTAIGNLDMIFVKKFFPADISGLYNSWSLFAKIILYVVGPISQVSFVFFSDSSQKHLQKKVLKIALEMLLVIAAVGYFGYSYIGRLLINILFGDKFAGVAPFLGYAAIFGFGYAAITFFNIYFLAIKSRVALLPFISIPLYVVFMFFLPKQIINIMYINIVFSFVLSLFYSYFFFFKKIN